MAGDKRSVFLHNWIAVPSFLFFEIKQASFLTKHAYSWLLRKYLFQENCVFFRILGLFEHCCVGNTTETGGEGRDRTSWWEAILKQQRCPEVLGMEHNVVPVLKDRIITVVPYTGLGQDPLWLQWELDWTLGVTHVPKTPPPSKQALEGPLSGNSQAFGLPAQGATPKPWGWCFVVVFKYALKATVNLSGVV